MEIKQLEIFACIAKNLNFSKTAEEMYLSQPTVSSQISTLEKSLGVQLLARNTKGVSLTKMGSEFLTYTHKILALRDEAALSVSGRDKNVKGTIDIISSTIPAQHLLPEIITLFQKEWPNITFRVDRGDSRQVEKEMGSFRYDFGMIGTAPDDDRFISYAVYNDRLVLVVPDDWPINLKTIRENFADYIVEVPFIMREPGSGTRVETEAILSKTGVNLQKLHIPATFSDAHGILLAVSRGMGCSLVPKIAAVMYEETGLLKVIDINSPLFRRQIFLLHNKELWLSPIQQSFADYARQFYESSSNDQS